MKQWLDWLVHKSDSNTVDMVLVSFGHVLCSCLVNCGPMNNSVQFSFYTLKTIFIPLYVVISKEHFGVCCMLGRNVKWLSIIYLFIYFFGGGREKQTISLNFFQMFPIPLERTWRSNNLTECSSFLTLALWGFLKLGKHMVFQCVLNKTACLLRYKMFLRLESLAK